MMTNNQVFSVNKLSNAEKPPELAKPMEDEVFLPAKIKSNANSASRDNPALSSEIPDRDLLILKTRESTE